MSMTITKETHPELWERLRDIWINEGRPQYVISGQMYTVFTPTDEPVFAPQASDMNMYATVSVGPGVGLTPSEPAVSREPLVRGKPTSRPKAKSIKPSSKLSDAGE